MHICVTCLDETISSNSRWLEAVHSLASAHEGIGDTTRMYLVHMIAIACIHSMCADRV